MRVPFGTTVPAGTIGLIIIQIDVMFLNLIKTNNYGFIFFFGTIDVSIRAEFKEFHGPLRNSTHCLTKL